MFHFSHVYLRIDYSAENNGKKRQFIIVKGRGKVTWKKSIAAIAVFLMENVTLWGAKWLCPGLKSCKDASQSRKTASSSCWKQQEMLHLSINKCMKFYFPLKSWEWICLIACTYAATSYLAHSLMTYYTLFF